MLHYIIQTIAFQLFFLIVYDVFLKKETFFNWNRAYLLATAILSFVIPLIKINQLQSVVAQEYIINLPEVIIGELSKQNLTSNTIETVGLETSQISIWQVVFYLGMIFSAFLFLFKISKIFRLITKNPKLKKGNLLIVNILNSRDAFSFLNYVFLGEKINPEEKATILTHEQVHVKQKHTLDLLFFEALRIVFWFNPLVYMYQNSISALHEFIADSKVSKQLDASQYYQNLLSQVFDTNKVSFINSFYKQSLIKKRIIMLSKSKSKQHQLLKYALLIPLVFSMLIYSSANAQELKTSNLSDEELKAKYYNELLDMEQRNSGFKETWEAYRPNLDEYIQSREDYYRSGAYFRRIAEKKIDSKKEKGEYTQEVKKFNDKMLSLANRTYEEYLEHKKTERAKETWENSVYDGLLRIVVDDMDNLTEEDNKRIYGKELMMKNDTFYKKLVVTDGYKTKIIYSPNNKGKATVDNEDAQDSINLNENEVPFAVIEEVPIYSGCESFEENTDRKACMSDKISKHVAENFNTKIAKEAGLKGKQRIMVIFKIDKDGLVTGVRARAVHPELEKEAIRVVKSLPKMTPGKQKGGTVIVPYSLPIVFEVK